MSALEVGKLTVPWERVYCVLSTGEFIQNRDAKFRNARFKLVPAVAKGPWVVQKSVGTTPLIVGGALKVRV